METSRFCHLTVDDVQKSAYVWHEADWKFTNDWHSHKMGQLIFVEKGVQYLYTPTRTYLLPTHHCAWVPSGVIHKTSAPSGPVYLRCIFIDDVPNDPFFSELSIFHTPKIVQEMILYSERWSRLEKYDAIELDFIKALIGILPATFKSSIPLILPAPQNPRIVNIINYLTENIGEDIKVVTLANHFGMSSRTMERLFKSDLGMNTSKYIKLFKIIKAVELLSVPGENVKSVAGKVGYNSVSTFSNTFSDVLGVRPNDMVIK